eukprot:7951622-Pyramimonas_sp.AAC.1
MHNDDRMANQGALRPCEISNSRPVPRRCGFQPFVQGQDVHENDIQHQTILLASWHGLIADIVADCRANTIQARLLQQRRY